MLALLNQLAVSFDLPILEWIQHNLQCGFLDTVMPIITLFGEGGIFWIAWALVLFCIPRHRKTGTGMLLALIMGVLVCNVTLKPLVGRIRPYDFQADLGVTVNLLINAQHDFSFPSGHTIASFEAAVVLLLNDKRMGIPAMVICLLVTLSRLYLYVHYPTDVIFSIFAGTGFAFLGNALAPTVVEKLPLKKGKFEA